jgi:hypothetical protein
MLKQYEPRGLTLAEVVFFIIALALVISLALVTFPRRVRSTAFRMTCGTNLASIGKAIAIYVNDYQNEYPHAGGPGGSWAARTPDWMGGDRFEAYGMVPGGQTGGQASISASLYLLVRYVEVTPKTFVCERGEPRTTPFDPARYRARSKQLEDLWDFGPEPPKHVSYAYHQVYGPHRLTADANPGIAVAADRNPWMASPFAKARVFSEFKPDIAPFNGPVEAALRGNTLAHQGEGQNVLFVESHAEFVKRPFCSIDDDNIYTSWDGADKIRGLPATFGSVPADPNDSLLVNDPAKP